MAVNSLLAKITLLKKPANWTRLRTGTANRGMARHHLIFSDFLVVFLVESDPRHRALAFLFVFCFPFLGLDCLLVFGCSSQPVSDFSKGSPHNPKGPFRTKNTTALDSVVFYYRHSFFYYFCSDLLLNFPFKNSGFKVSAVFFFTISVAICCLISL